MADNVQLQGIEFEIVGETEKAVNGITALTASLKKLRSVTSKGLGLSKLVQELKEISSAVGQTNGVSQMVASIAEISRARNKIASVADSLEKIAKLNFSNLNGAAQTITAIAGSAKSGSGKGNTNATPGVSNDLLETEHVDSRTKTVKEAADALDDADESAKSTAKDLKFAAKAAQAFRSGVIDGAKALGQGAVNAAKFAGKLVSLPLKRLTENIKRVVFPLKQFVSSLGRIAAYRAIRSIISGITSALQEGIKNLYEYSKIVGTTFHTAMDMAATDALWLKNSLAAAVAPIVESLMPALDALSAKVVTVMNQIAQFVAILGGKSVYSKAIKSAKEYGDATGDAAKEMHMLISGFDELNAFADRSGKDVDYSSMFEETDVDSDLGDFGKRLKDAFSNMDWDDLGKMLADKLNDVLSGIDWHNFAVDLGEKINGVVQTAYSFLKNLDLKSAGSDLAQWFNGLFESVDFETTGRLVIRKLTAVFDFIIGFIKSLDWTSAALAIGNFFKGAFAEASEWLHNQDFKDIGKTLSDGVKKILDGILDAVKQMDWFAVGKAIGDFLGSIDWLGIFTRVAEIVWTAFKGVVTGLLSTSGGRMFLFLFTSIKALSLVFTLAKPLLSLAVEEWIRGGLSPLSTIPTIIDTIAIQTSAAAEAIGNAVLAIAPWIIGAFDAILAAYDAKAIYDCVKGYKAANEAYMNEVSTAMNSYAKLYHDKGKEAADEWAMAVYQIDTSNMNLTQAMQALTQEVDSLWGDTPKSMWEGFKAGWDYYFGTDGIHLLRLLKDAFMGVINGIRDLLGIHSPSTVFYDMGADLAQGLFNGISENWNVITEFFTTELTNTIQFFAETWATLKTATSEAWDLIKSTVIERVTELKSTVTNDLTALKTDMTSKWNEAKNVTINAWNELKSAAQTKFQEVKSTVITRMTEATNHLRSIEWGSIGTNLVNGFLNGLRNAWSAVTSWVSSAAASITNKLKSALKIGSPSKLWAEIGEYLDMGLEQGLDSGTDSLLGTAGKIANAVTGAMNPAIPSPSVLAAGMSSYGVNAPNIEEGAMDDGDGEGMYTITSILEQMFEYMRTAGRGDQDVKVIIDGREVFNAVVNENNRAIQRTGASPIRV